MNKKKHTLAGQTISTYTNSLVVVIVLVDYFACDVRDTRINIINVANSLSFWTEWCLTSFFFYFCLLIIRTI